MPLPSPPHDEDDEGGGGAPIGALLTEEACVLCHRQQSPAGATQLSFICQITRHAPRGRGGEGWGHSDAFTYACRGEGEGGGGVVDDVCCTSLPLIHWGAMSFGLTLQMEMVSKCVYALKEFPLFYCQGAVHVSDSALVCDSFPANFFIVVVLIVAILLSILVWIGGALNPS